MLDRRLVMWTMLAGVVVCLVAPAHAQEAPETVEEKLKKNGIIGMSGPAHEAYVIGRAERARAVADAESTRKARTLALDWLKQHQADDGSWSATEFELQCRLNKCGDPATAMTDAGVTGAALCAFVATGTTSKDETYGETLRLGLQYLVDRQSAEGCFADADASLRVHDHLWGALAMTEAFAMTGSRRWRLAAKRAVSFVLAAQNPYLAWGQGVRQGRNDTGRTALAMAVLRSAQSCDLFEGGGVEVKGAVAWIDKLTDPKTGRIGNERRGGVNDPTAFPRLPGLAPTAAGLLVRMLAGQRLGSTGPHRPGVELLRGSPPSPPEEATPPDYETWYWGGLAAHQIGGATWASWRQPLLRELRTSQFTTKGRDERGSWPAGHPRARHGGRVFATALNAMSLAVDRRYARLFPVAD
jgi:hypothetical protein